jgi:hypothetical protein
MRGKEFLWVPVADFAGATYAKRAGIKACDAADTGLLGENAIPKILASMSDAGDWPDPCDNGASSAHVATWFSFAST